MHGLAVRITQVSMVKSKVRKLFYVIWKCEAGGSVGSQDPFGPKERVIVPQRDVTEVVTSLASTKAVRGEFARIEFCRSLYTLFHVGADGEGVQVPSSSVYMFVPPWSSGSDVAARAPYPPPVPSPCLSE